MLLCAALKPVIMLLTRRVMSPDTPTGYMKASFTCCWPDANSGMPPSIAAAETAAPRWRSCRRDVVCGTDAEWDMSKLLLGQLRGPANRLSSHVAVAMWQPCEIHKFQFNSTFFCGICLD